MAGARAPLPRAASGRRGPDKDRLRRRGAPVRPHGLHGYDQPTNRDERTAHALEPGADARRRCDGGGNWGAAPGGAARAPSVAAAPEGCTAHDGGAAPTNGAIPRSQARRAGPTARGLRPGAAAGHTQRCAGPDSSPRREPILHGLSPGQDRLRIPSGDRRVADSPASGSGIRNSGDVMPRAEDVAEGGDLGARRRMGGSSTSQNADGLKPDLVVPMSFPPHAATATWAVATAINASTRSRSTPGCLMAQRTRSTACIAVVWSRPPTASPIAG